MSTSDSARGRGRQSLPPRLDPRAGRPSRHPAADPHPAAGRGRAGGGLAVTIRVFAGLLSVLLLGGTGWGWYLARIADASVNRTDAIPTSGNVDTSHHGADMNLLLVGNDSRLSATPAELKQLNTQQDGGSINTDTMILVHLPADGSAASFVSFPRDSYVQIPGHGWDKLNSAYADGVADAGPNASTSARQAAGAQLLIRTVSQLTGLQIDHYAEVDLLGFFKLSNVVGGVQVNLCAPVKDHYSGVDLPAGVQTISGSQALAFVRQRHGLKRGDFDRIIRQQTFIAGIIRKMLSQHVLLNVSKQRQLVQAAAGALTVDQNLDLFSLAQQMQSVKLGNINFQTIPYVGDDQDSRGRYILRLKDLATEHEFFANLSAPKQTQPVTPSTTAAPKTVSPGQVTVAVYNGSGETGLAAKTATSLKARGFTVASTGNADNDKYTATEIRYATGDEALAATVAAAIPGATTAESDEAHPGTVELVLGSDFNGVGNPVTTHSAAPSSSGPQGEDARTAADTSCIN